MTKQNNNSEKIWDTSLKRDLIVKSIPATLTVLAVVFGIFKLTIEFNHENKLEFSRNLYKNRVEAYEELGDIIGHLVVSAKNNNDTLFSEYSSSFNIMHLKLVPLIMDDDVDKVMGEFIQSIKDFENNYIQYEDFNMHGYTVLKECQLSLKRCYIDLIPKSGVVLLNESNDLEQVLNDIN